MAELKDGIPLHQPVGKVHKANRRPLRILWAAGVMLVIIAAAAWVMVMQHKQEVVTQEETEMRGDPIPATSEGHAIVTKLLHKQGLTTAGSDPVATDASASVPPVTKTSAPEPNGLAGIPAIDPRDGPQSQEPHLTSEEEEAQQAEQDEIEAIETAPSMQGLPSTSVNQSISPSNADSTAALLAAAKSAEANQGNTANAISKLLHGGDGTGESYGEQNGQAEKQAYYQAGRAKGLMIVPRGIPEPKDACVIHAGWDIPAILEQSADSDLPGELRARVREDVFDSKTGSKVCIPRNSILLGDYNSNVGYAQNRVQVAWHTLEFPDDRPDVDLGNMAGLGADGKAGLGGQVNNHYKRLIGFALLSSAFAAGVELSQNRNTSALAYPSSGQVVGQAVGQQMGEFGSRMTERNANIQPTVNPPAGTHFNVRVNRTIVFME